MRQRTSLSFDRARSDRSSLWLRLVPKARVVAQPGMKWRDQWRPFYNQVPLALCFLSKPHPAFHAGLGNKCLFGTGCGLEEAKSCRLLYVSLAAASAKGTFCCPARYEMPGPMETFYNQVPKARHIFTVVAQERSRTMCRAFGTMFSVETTPGISCRAG